jgi:hypothetical protein
MLMGMIQPSKPSTGGGFSLALAATMQDLSGPISPLTFSSQNFGTVDSTRQLIAAIAMQPNGGATVPSAVTIGGVSATLVPSSHSAGNVDVSQWIASVPTGTSGNVVITFGGGGYLRVTVGLYALYGASSVVKQANVASGFNSSESQAFNFAQYGVVVATGGGFSSGNFSGVNLTTDQIFTIPSTLGLGSLSNLSSTGNVTFTVNWTAGQVNDASFVAYGP